MAGAEMAELFYWYPPFGLMAVELSYDAIGVRAPAANNDDHRSVTCPSHSCEILPSAYSVQKIRGQKDAPIL
jgi:hypothetical protein